jgi:hypothetical protein
MNMNCRELQLYDIPETVFLFNVNFRELTVNYRELCLLGPFGRAFSL